MSQAPTKPRSAVSGERDRRAAATAPALTAYRALTWLARPMAGAILRHRERRGKEDPARMGERLGEPSLPRPPGPVLWVHAASVGEANSVLPLISRLAADRPDATLLFTTGTVTSARMLASRLPPRTIHQYVPLDAPQIVDRFLRYWRPAIAIFTEQEIWPNLVVGVSARGIPLAVVNARMSAASFDRWNKRRKLAAALFSRFDVVLAQTDEIALRFKALGAPVVRAVGNLKIDAPPPPADREEVARLIAAIGGRPRVLAASTHAGEDEIVIAAHRQLSAAVPRLLTIIAPRHPDRGQVIASHVRAAGLTPACRSLGDPIVPGVDIYVADTIGELGTFFALAPVSFIGGSLIPHGGQNPIEAVRHGSVVLTGPSRDNFVESYEALLSANAALAVSDAATLADAIRPLLAEPDRLAHVRRAATLAIDTLSGALDRTATALHPLIPLAVEMPRAS